MFDFNKWMDINGITYEDISHRLNIEEEQIDIIIKSKDGDLVWKLWEDYVQAEADEYLLPELLAFYSEFFTDNPEAELFIKEILSYRESNIPRRMINSIERLVTIADKMDLIKKGNASLKIFFIVVCIETLNTLAEIDIGKLKMVTNFFTDYVSREHQEYILSKVKRSLADSRYDSHTPFDTDIDIGIFAHIINELRNKFAHEGNYFSFSFADRDDLALINSLTIHETREEQKRNGRNFKQERVYDIKLQYRDFRFICVNGMIRFAKEYFDGIK